MTKKKTVEEFKEELYRALGNSFILKSDYTNNKTKVKVEHTVCGATYEIIPKSLLKGVGCPKCNSKKAGKDRTDKGKDNFAKVIKSTKEEYVMVDPYKKSKEKVRILHTLCNSIYSVTPDKFTQGRRCPVCFGNNKPSQAEFKKRVLDYAKGEYVFTGEYTNSNTPMGVIHTECGDSFMILPRKFFGGAGCPKCARKGESSGARQVAEWLDTSGLSYESEVSFPELYHLDSRYPLRYDFGVTVKGMLYLIEYDGEQHFKPTGFDTKESFEKRTFRDKLKTSYCESNDIPLLRISYKQKKSINKILDSKLGGLE